ncbi:MAG: hypothetical protein LBL64_08290 [Treponema sp.]|nr:hypothetical protein [Treponema sp.]
MGNLTLTEDFFTQRLASLTHTEGNFTLTEGTIHPISSCFYLYQEAILPKVSHFDTFLGKFEDGRFFQFSLNFRLTNANILVQ